MKKSLFGLFLLLIANICYAADVSVIGAPQDSGWTAHISDATSTTTNGYNPSLSTVSEVPVTLNASSFTGVILRARYTSGQSLTTDPVISCFGKKGNQWEILKDENGSRSITLSDQSNDTTDGTYEYTDPSDKIDAMGSSYIKCSVTTAAVASSGGVAIEISRY